MKFTDGSRMPRTLTIICLTLVALASMPLLSKARATSTSVNIVNNSSRQIRSVYQSHVNVDDWSGNVLGSATIGPGQSFTVSNITCDEQQVKIVAEDVDGCFAVTVVTCGNS